MTGYKQIYKNLLTDGQLFLQYCPSCEEFIFYPRERCPKCFTDLLEWRPVSGNGTVHSFSIINVSALPQFQSEVPYVYALVDLPEGIRMAVNIIDCPADQLQIGLPVKLTLIKREGQTLPVFEPV